MVSLKRINKTGFFIDKKKQEKRGKNKNTMPHRLQMKNFLVSEHKNMKTKITLAL